VKVALVGRDLLFGSRIAGVVDRAGHMLIRIDDPSGLPEPAAVSIVLIDWTERGPAWADQLRAWNEAVPPADRARLVLFGSHSDLSAHAAAAAAGLGPMWARSRVISDLPRLLA
jgi:hypothetical protein